jgi:hypothetical protein
MDSNSKITLLEVKQALRDSRFRASLGETFREDMQKYEQNPSCACNFKIYERVATEAKTQLMAYYPGRVGVIDAAEEAKRLAQNHFSVINCHINELEEKLRALPPGRKQIESARWEDQVTVIVNELDIIY